MTGEYAERKQSWGWGPKNYSTWGKGRESLQEENRGKWSKEWEDRPSITAGRHFPWPWWCLLCSPPGRLPCVCEPRVLVCPDGLGHQGTVVGDGAQGEAAVFTPLAPTHGHCVLVGTWDEDTTSTRCLSWPVSVSLGPRSCVSPPFSPEGLK